ncbi:MAG: class I SAM-dependent methyltransferase [Planctomycetaceae bacterium]
MPDKSETKSDDRMLTDSSHPSSEMLRLERICCPLCGSANSTAVQISRDNLCGIVGEFVVERCDACGHRFMNPRPVRECLGACYPEHYGPHQSTPDAVTRPAAAVVSGSNNTNDHSGAGRPLLLRILPLRYVPGLKRLYNWLMDDRSQPLPPVPRMTSPGTAASTVISSSGETSAEGPCALELGCASGQYLVRLQDAGWKAVGIEPGSRPAMMAQQAGLDVHCGTLECCDLPREHFDLVAAWMVFEHIPDVRQTLEGVHDLLKPGGTLLFSIPNAGCWEATFFGRYWYVWELPRHLHHFTPSSIRTLLQQCGFEDIQIAHQRNVSNIVGSVALAILARWPECRFGRWLLRYPDRPTFVTKLLLAPLAHVLAWIRQGGRLTISAHRPLSKNVCMA